MTNDPKEILKQYYSPSVKQPQIIIIPPMNFLMIDGHGDPNTDSSYSAAVSALYTLAYTLKFGLKNTGTPDFKVFPLQGLWWAADMNTFLTGEKSAWDFLEKEGWELISVVIDKNDNQMAYFKRPYPEK